ncbi:hypothetical protein [Priestia filamentosa]|uniref:hypothetical protein n=1 Tax=Priestia filamentosa TaxID=1402861 RepID=UPI000A08343F|nr:hypothetical protein [Priestia filamentosa]MDT3763541.1 hypothetical protein [Priestia filamentosa]WRU93978.1 hypothetical protein RYX51_13180 [Priestia filamentosa]SMF16467.1 hypothetical protein SAMN06296056_1011324 [Priestia filamentosa]
MIKKSLLKKVTLVTALTLTLGSLSSLGNLADKDVLAEGVSTDGIELNKNVLSDDFDLEESVENMPSLDQMTSEEKELFNSIVQEQVSLAGLENKKEEGLFTEAMVDFFDKSSDTYNDFDLAQSELEEQFEESNTGDFNNEEDQVAVNEILNQTFGVGKADAAQVKVGVKFAGAVFNTAIGFAIGGGAGAIQAFIVKKGKKEAQKLFTRTVVSRLKAWGAPKLAAAVGTSVTIALNYADVGTQIAKQLDKRDKRPNNGWIDLY